jgi:hypothetical protein
MSDDEVINQLDVSQTTWRRYRNGKQKPPLVVCKFLHIMTGYLPWSGWTNCFVNRREQKLYIDDYKDGLTRHDLQVYWWQIQELKTYRKDRVKQIELPSEIILELVPLSTAL